MAYVWIIVISLAIIAAASYLGRNYRQGLIDSGQIIARKAGFEEYSEIFTIKEIPFSDIRSAIQAANYYQKANVNAYDGKEAIGFNGAGWRAHLYHMSGEADRNAYCFEFTNWSTSNGVPHELNAMNTVLTAVEKAFLQLDPNTQVSTKKMEIRRKHKFF